jgi:hypothetical protein
MRRSLPRATACSISKAGGLRLSRRHCRRLELTLSDSVDTRRTALVLGAGSC